MASSYLPIEHEVFQEPTMLSNTISSVATGRDATGHDSFPFLCSDLLYLAPRQRELCELDASLIGVISQGALMGIEECQYQFQDRRWNCSTFNTTSVFGNVLKIRKCHY